MVRLFVSFAVLICLMSPVMADDAADPVKLDADNIDAIRDFFSERVYKIFDAIDEDPAQAEKLIADVAAVIHPLEPKEENAQKLVTNLKKSLENLTKQVILARTNVADALKAVEADRNSFEAFDHYVDKVIFDLRRGDVDPDKTEVDLKAAREQVAKLGEASTNEKIKQAAAKFHKTTEGIEKGIEQTRKLATLLGKQSIPLEVEAWVNGSPLSDADLKGKVVLLDFWAIWCGPCIATFPHLKEWNEKYSDQGLVIVGLTRYYKYEWDEKSRRPKASKNPDEVTPEAEQEMLKKFAERHKLKHRFAIEPKESKTVRDYYMTRGIPHVVLLDRSGKVRLVKVGSGKRTAEAIHAMIEKLLAEK